jgi:deoxyadenosine/deoxycytidine kinase
MHIVLDGLSGVGKTYYGRLFAEKHNMTFISFLPPEDACEIELHKHTVYRLSSTLEPMIFEGSPLLSLTVKAGLYKQGLLTLPELIKITSISETKLNPYLIICFRDTYDSILSRRIKRGRPYEYRRDLKSILDLDAFIVKQYTNLQKKDPNVKVTYLSLQNLTDEQVLAEMERIILNYCIN